MTQQHREVDTGGPAADGGDGGAAAGAPGWEQRDHEDQHISTRRLVEFLAVTVRRPFFTARYAVPFRDRAVWGYAFVCAAASCVVKPPQNRHILN